MSLKPKSRHRNRNKQSGQSFLELALSLPLLLILISGLVEFGFLLNEYLNVIDGPREGARFGVDFDPWEDMSTHSDDYDAFYDAVAQTTMDTISPIALDLANGDDVVISVFTLNGTSVQARYPQDSTVYSIEGQWSFQYWCTHHSGTHDSTTVQATLASTYCINPSGTYHVSRFTSADIEDMIYGTGANSNGAILVEIFYSYEQLLNLPWITAFVPNPIPTTAYTVMPVPSAKPLD